MRIAFSVAFCGALAFASCTNPAESFTDGAMKALLQNKDSLKALTRDLTQEATTTATAHVSNAIQESSRSLAHNAEQAVHRSADRIDSSIDRFYSSADRTVVNARRELTSPNTLRFIAQARDTLLGAPTQDLVRGLVQGAFQEFRRQQDSTLKALEGRSDSWQAIVQNLATPVLVTLGALAIVAVLVIAILRLFIFLKQRKQQ